MEIKNRLIISFTPSDIEQVLGQHAQAIARKEGFDIADLKRSAPFPDAVYTCIPRDTGKKGGKA